MDRNRRVVVIAFLVAIVCVVPLYNANWLEEPLLNSSIIQAIPEATGLLMLLVPLLMFLSFKSLKGIFEAVREDQKAQVSIDDSQKPVLDISWQKGPLGSEWFIRQKENSTLTNVNIIAEVKYASGEVKSEAFKVDLLKASKACALQSKLAFEAQAQTRILAITSRHYQLTHAGLTKRLWEGESSIS